MTASETFAIFQVQGVVTILLVSALLLRAVLLVARERRIRAMLRMGRDHLASLLDSEAGMSPADLEPMKSLPVGVQLRLVSEMTPNLTGAGRQRIALVGSALGLAEEGRRLAGSRHWKQRLTAARTLSVVEPDAPRMMEFFDDSEALVREEAVDWAVDHPSRQAVEAVIRLLDDEAPSVRFCAEDALGRMGSIPVEPLLGPLEVPGSRGIERALRIASSCPDSRFLPPALRYVREQSPGIRAAAVGLLGALGGDEAIDALDGALADPEEMVRARAAASLGLLAHWPSAARLSSLLEDGAWSVRLAAAQALACLGPSGLLYMQRAARTEGPARDIVRHVLDLQDPSAGLEGPR